MKTLSFVSLVFAVVCFVIAAFVAPTSPPWNSRLVAAGLAFFAGSFLLSQIPS